MPTLAHTCILRFALFPAIVLSVAGCVKRDTEQYAYTMVPEEFVSEVAHKYFTLKPGTTFTYSQNTEEGTERNEIVVTNEQKEVMGVQTTVAWDRVWLNDVLIEDTRDWYAQDREGNVWYFGEDVDNYENGTLKDHAGAWEAGVDGAKPGIIMRANPKVGDSYRQEYYPRKAEDMGDVVALTAEVSVPYGTFNNCLQTRDWSAIDTSTNEYKYYCPAVGFVTLETAVDSSNRVELVTVTTRR